MRKETILNRSLDLHRMISEHETELMTLIQEHNALARKWDYKRGKPKRGIKIPRHDLKLLQFTANQINIIRTNLRMKYARLARYKDKLIEAMTETTLNRQLEVYADTAHRVEQERTAQEWEAVKAQRRASKRCRPASRNGERVHGQMMTVHDAQVVDNDGDYIQNDDDGGKAPRPN